MYFCYIHVLHCSPEFTHTVLLTPAVMQAPPAPTSAPTTYFLFPVFVIHAASDDGPLRICLCIKDKNLCLSAREDSLCLALPHCPVLHTAIKIICELFLKKDKGLKKHRALPKYPGHITERNVGVSIFYLRPSSRRYILHPLFGRGHRRL